ncbi:alpha/beta fold hydrolase [Georgenia subflava]|uniref:Alpha/beta fold hydrolase n=1 Tax=Georgenia subflava TaxID=1622177 RepID=A0A6N7EKQ8_9MICO|nr:alpha/beta fold hydrolase [Georgenia subflava]MPV38729.1 alpha/beta fold hydrolase [Georgenia subflava]
MSPLRRFDRGLLRFDLRDDGPEDGFPVLLLHGFPQDGTSWSRVVPHLHAAGLRTLVPDQRGYSPGARPPGRGAYRLEFLVADVLGLLDSLGLARVHLVGHDWGGGVAWAAAARAPERTASLTVLSTPHPAAMLASMPRSRQPLRSGYMAAFQLPALPERLIAPRLEQALRRRGLPAADAGRYARRMREPATLTAALNWYRALPMSHVRTPPVTVPTTYVWGARDFALGRTAAELTERYVHAPYRFVELSAGHWLPETEADEVAAAIIARTRAT